MPSFAPKNGTSGLVNVSGDGGAALPANAQVTFGATPAASVTYRNPRLIQAGVPSGLANGVVGLKLNDVLLGGFTVGPPLTGLVVMDATISPDGGTLNILGNGFKEQGRNNSPTVAIRNQSLTGQTVDDSAIVVDGVNAGADGTCFPFTVTFSDRATATATLCFMS